MSDASLGSSARLLLSNTARHWGLIVGGVVASVVGWVLFAFNIGNIPLWIFQVIAVVLILVAVVRAYHDLRLERDKFESERDNLRHSMADERARVTRHAYIRRNLGELVSRCEYYLSALTRGAEVPSEDIQQLEAMVARFLAHDLKDDASSHQLFARTHHLPRIPTSGPVAQADMKAVEERLLWIRSVVLECLKQFPLRSDVNTR
jgi:hypothetical protein